MRYEKKSYIESSKVIVEENNNGKISISEKNDKQRNGYQQMKRNKLATTGLFNYRAKPLFADTLTGLPEQVYHSLTKHLCLVGTVIESVRCEVA